MVIDEQGRLNHRNEDLPLSNKASKNPEDLMQTKAKGHHHVVQFDGGKTSSAKAKAASADASNPKPRVQVAIGASGVHIANMWASRTSTGAFDVNSVQSLANSILRQEGLINGTDSCDRCKPLVASQDHDCCLQWMQSGAYINSIEELRFENSTWLKVVLAAEKGLNSDVIQFVRGVKLGYTAYIKLVDQLKTDGIHSISQMSGIDPVEFVQEMGYFEQDFEYSLLIAKITEKVDSPIERSITNQSHVNWDTEGMIRKYGLLRGVLVTGATTSTNLHEALQFTPNAALSTEESLKKALMLQPDEKTAEMTVQSTDSKNVSKVNYMIENFGISSLNSKSFDIGADVNLGAAPVSAAFNFNSSDKALTRENRSNKSIEYLTGLTKEYTKTLYFVEPRKLLAVDPALLQPTPALKQAFRKVKRYFESGGKYGYSAVDLFRDFGTHTCTKALLGGWWKMSVQETTDQAIRGMDMAKHSSYVLEEAVNKLWGLGISANFSKKGNSSEGAAPGVTFGISGGGNDQKILDKSKSSSTETKSTLNDTNIMSDVVKEWKGGAGDATVDTWRKSLDDPVQWKVIDRFIDSCQGIWRWSPNRELSQKICNGWRQGFVQTLLELGSDVESSAGIKQCDEAIKLTSF